MGVEMPVKEICKNKLVSKELVLQGEGTKSGKIYADFQYFPLVRSEPDILPTIHATVTATTVETVYNIPEAVKMKFPSLKISITTNEIQQSEESFVMAMEPNPDPVDKTNIINFGFNIFSSLTPDKTRNFRNLKYIDRLVQLKTETDRVVAEKRVSVSMTAIECEDDDGYSNVELDYIDAKFMKQDKIKVRLGIRCYRAVDREPDDEDFETATDSGVFQEQISDPVEESTPLPISKREPRIEDSITIESRNESIISDTQSIFSARTLHPTQSPNLLINSLNFCVKLAIEQADDYSQVLVTLETLKIPEGTVQKFFQVFIKLSSTKIFKGMTSGELKLSKVQKITDTKDRDLDFGGEKILAGFKRKNLIDFSHTVLKIQVKSGQKTLARGKISLNRLNQMSCSINDGKPDWYILSH